MPHKNPEVRRYAELGIMTTIREIEGLTGLSFSKLSSIRSDRAAGLWEAAEEGYISGCAGSS